MLSHKNENHRMGDGALSGKQGGGPVLKAEGVEVGGCMALSQGQESESAITVQLQFRPCYGRKPPDVMSMKERYAKVKATGGLLRSSKNWCACCDRIKSGKKSGSKLFKCKNCSL
ncbi:hypothetical protein AVEN_218232-1 [Araneus ventricosus]|uniref:Uncharacterized protein n=1 Tax=Araneus ventricosus TaxID=182803 RepID=A0A4Y2WIB8_ARAVE|nr:hypothetical protein AVEN_102262-1 [Araneus ventricosus]GBO36959.1 hypothetical protein AVEN_218232-1 [Araneus ventricosus]